MQLTLTITPDDSLPESVLKAFINKAQKQNQDPTTALAGLIRGFVSPSARPTTKRKPRKASK
jgi:hypothetical protein